MKLSSIRYGFKIRIVIDKYILTSYDVKIFAFEKTQTIPISSTLETTTSNVSITQVGIGS
jgi:hypothetical protein